MSVYPFAGKAPQLGDGVYIAPNATVLGDVVLGDDASVWFSAVVRGDMHSIRIGARTNIQDGAVVHVTTAIAPTRIGDDCVVGHLALVHGATVGDRVLIGMGAVVLDLAEIGDDCVIAAGSVVPPRTKIPAGSLVRGNPAKIVRETTEQDRLMVRAGVESYRGVKALYAAEGLGELTVAAPHG